MHKNEFARFEHEEVTLNKDKKNQNSTKWMFDEQHETIQ